VDLFVEDQSRMRVARLHEVLLQCAGIACPALVCRVERDAPAASVDPVVALDQFRERVPGGCIQRADRVGHCLELAR